MDSTMRRPNILLLYTDQQRWDALAASDNDEIRTPNLDGLAADGLNFHRHFVQNPVCMPSRASFLTGQYPSTLRIFRNGVPLPQDTPTLPHMLRGYGYICANIGKLHFENHANTDHTRIRPGYGFDHLEISDEPGCYEDAYRAWVRRKCPEALDRISCGLPPAALTWRKVMGDSDDVVHPGQRFPKQPIAFGAADDLTHTAFVAEQTMEFLAAHRARQFLCIAGFYSPHSPWIAPRRFIDLYDPDALTLPEFPEDVNARRSEDRFSNRELRLARQGYYAMVSEVDHHVGRILARLEELGLAENTIVVFTSDHGEWLGEHLRYGKGFPAADCISRVPLIVRWPEGIASPGRRVEAIVEAIDVLPTLLESCGMPVPRHVQGRSLAECFRGADFAGRASALTEMHQAKAVRTDRFRYVVRADGDERLFDLSEDPGEYRNLAAVPAFAEALADCRKEMLSRLIELERPLPRQWAY